MTNGTFIFKQSHYYIYNQETSLALTRLSINSMYNDSLSFYKYTVCVYAISVRSACTKLNFYLIPQLSKSCFWQTSEYAKCETAKLPVGNVSTLMSCILFYNMLVNFTFNCYVSCSLHTVRENEV